MRKPQKEIVAVRLSPETITKLHRIAAKEGKYFSELIRDVLVEYIKPVKS